MHTAGDIASPARAGKETAVNPTFDAIKSETYAERIARRVMAMIATGELSPGDVLPAQRELADSFQVSRTVLREAFGTLATRGLISVQHGRPTVVNDPSHWNTLDPAVLMLLRAEVTLRELMELRFVVEPEAASLAAQRITDEELDGLRPLLDPLHNVAQDKHVEADTAFHQGIIRATQNTVLLINMSSVVDLLRESRRVTFRVEDGIPLGAAWHRAIMEALEQRDPEAARRAMTGHLKQVESTLNEFLASNQATGDGVWFASDES